MRGETKVGGWVAVQTGSSRNWRGLRRECKPVFEVQRGATKFTRGESRAIGSDNAKNAISVDEAARTLSPVHEPFIVD